MPNETIYRGFKISPTREGFYRVWGLGSFKTLRAAKVAVNAEVRKDKYSKPKIAHRGPARTGKRKGG